MNSKSHAAWALAAGAVLLAGCDSDSAGPADPRRVAVPDRDESPPAVTIRLATRGDARTLAEASQPPGGPHTAAVKLAQPRLLATTLGGDPDGGVARVRVSISERITCRGADGRQFERLRRRYFPPPQIERIRSAPGAVLPTRERRSLQLALIGNRCGNADGVAVHGQLWGEAINGQGLEAVTPHIRFSYPG